MLALYLSLIDNEQDKNLFEQLYEQHRHTMLLVANRILHDQMLAEDCVHDAFLKILDHLEKISDPKCNKTRSFIVLIVRNIAIDCYRKQKKMAETSIHDLEWLLVDEGSNPAVDAENQETDEVVREIFARLHPSYAEILALSIGYDCNDKEIADILGISAGNARLRLHRARKQFASHMTTRRDQL